ncbi:serine-arginine repressor protein [Cladochytrium replicatum]|nr:serine-arginine repressor protein [Cladochytrium replicatum]
MSARRKSLHVRGIDNSTSADSLREAFEKYGEVRDVYIPRDYYTKDIRGFAYIEFADPPAAEKAFEKIEYLTINNRKLMVEWAKGERQAPAQMRARDRTSSRRDRSRSRDRSSDRYRPRGGRSRSRSRDRSDRDRERSGRRRSYSRSGSPPRRRDREDDRDYKRRGSARSRSRSGSR